MWKVCQKKWSLHNFCSWIRNGAWQFYDSLKHNMLNRKLKTKQFYSINLYRILHATPFLICALYQLNKVLRLKITLINFTIQIVHEAAIVQIYLLVYHYSLYIRLGKYYKGNTQNDFLKAARKNSKKPLQC